MKLLSMSVLFLVAIYVAAGQTARPQIIEQMKELTFLLGNWEGKVRYEQGTYKDQEVFWNVHVYRNYGGNILLIDEKGRETTTEVLGVVSWDSATNGYLARLHYFSNGKASSIAAKGYTQNNALVLQTTDSGTAPRRYIIKVKEKGQWHAVSDVTNDNGKSWTRRWEMNLTRQE